MNSGSQSQKFPLAIRALHWSMALLIIGLLASGLIMSDIPLKAPDKWDMYPWHRALGVVAFVLVLARIWIRFRKRAQMPELPQTLPAHERFGAKAAQVFLYAALIAIPVVGYISSSAVPEFPGIPPLLNIWFFGAELPLLPIERNYDITKLFIDIHAYVAYTMIAVLLAHIAGALKHRFFDKPENDVLSKMM